MDTDSPSAVGLQPHWDKAEIWGQKYMKMANEWGQTNQKKWQMANGRWQKRKSKHLNCCSTDKMTSASRTKWEFRSPEDEIIPRLTTQLEKRKIRVNPCSSVVFSCTVKRHKCRRVVIAPSGPPPAVAAKHTESNSENQHPAFAPTPQA